MKTGPNERRRNRARSALKYIDDALEHAEGAVQLRQGKPEVWLIVPPPTKIDWTMFDRLDRDKVDDELVALAATYGEEAIIFSHDRGPRISARLLNVKTLKPEDDWLLPVEKSDKDRKIEQLERAVRERYPSIQLKLGSDRETDRIEFACLDVSPLTDTEISLRVQAVKDANPRARFRQRMGIEALVGDHGDIEGYHRKYDAFEEGLAKKIGRLHELVAAASRMISIPFTITNSSSQTAQGLRIDFAVTGGYLLPDTDDFYQTFRDLFPACPDIPQPVFGLGRLYNPALELPSREPRDPIAFYWFDRPGELTRSGALQCEDFRSRRSWENQADIMIPTDVTDGSLGLKIHASNLPDPVTAEVSFALVHRKTDWDDPVVKEIVRRCLSGFFEGG